MKSVLLVMSLSVTVMLLLQMTVSLILKKVMSANVKYFLIKLSVIFYLAPLPLIKNYYMDLFGEFGYNTFGLSEEKIYSVDVIKNAGIRDINVSSAFKIFIIIFVVLYLIMIVMLARQAILYFILNLRIAKGQQRLMTKI